MKQHQVLLIASLLAVLLSVVIIYRGISAEKNFDRTVKESLKTTEGYDQRFIDMVNRLEELLATRAQFGYSGGKDPMTGTKRQVVQPKQVASGKARIRKPAATGTQAAAEPEPVEDPVKLTAIIADATGKKITAVVMDGERSYSVDPGDIVANRKITKITSDGIYMETDTTYYFYDIYGNAVIKSKTTGEVSSFLKDKKNREVEKRGGKPQKEK